MSFMHPLPPISSLFPYTTLFRSGVISLKPIIADRHQKFVGGCFSVGSQFFVILTRRRLSSREKGPSRCPGKIERERARSEEHTSELQSLTNLVCRLLLEKKK